MANEDCKAFLKYFRKEDKAKKDEKIDKRYKPYLAPNNKYYEAHCGYCAEVQYLTEIHEKSIDYQEEDQKRAQKLINMNEEDLIATEAPCQSFAISEALFRLLKVDNQNEIKAAHAVPPYREEDKRSLGKYKPNQNSFNTYIDYIIGRPGQKATYEGYKKFKKERERKQ